MRANCRMSNYSLWSSDLYRVFLILMSQTERTLLRRLWWMTATLAGCVGMNTAARHPVTGKHWHKGSSSSAGEVRLSVQIACNEAKLSDLNSNRSKRHISVQPWIKKITENSKKHHYFPCCAYSRGAICLIVSINEEPFSTESESSNSQGHTRAGNATKKKIG